MRGDAAGGVGLVQAHHGDGPGLQVAVDDAQRDLLGQGGELVLAHGRAGQEEPGRPHGQHVVDRRVLQGVLQVGDEGHQDVVGVGGVAPQAAQEDVEEGVVQVGDDDGQARRAPGRQLGRGRVGPVPEGARRAQDALPGAIGHAPLALEGQRDQAARDPRRERDVLLGGGAGARAWRWCRGRCGHASSSGLRRCVAGQDRGRPRKGSTRILERASKRARSGHHCPHKGIL